MPLYLAFISFPATAEWIFIIIVLAILFYWIRTIIHIAQSQYESTNIKTVWLVVVIFLGVPGAFVYDVAGRGTVIKSQ